MPEPIINESFQREKITVDEFISKELGSDQHRQKVNSVCRLRFLTEYVMF